MKKFTFLFLLTLSFIFLWGGISNANITVFRTSPDNTRAVFSHLNETKLFGLMIWAESLKTSSFEGRLAVGSVALERNDGYRWGIKKTLLHYDNYKYGWFSCFNPDDKGFQHLKRIALNFSYYFKRLNGLQESCRIATALLNGSQSRHKMVAEHRVKHYAAIGCENEWTRKMTVVAVLDGHKFLV
jgi:hypothetical protein